MDIMSNTNNYTIHSLVQRYEDKTLTVTDFNNGSEPWKVNQKKAYIESLILGFPSNQFIAVENELGNIKIVDGCKRFLSIIEFLNDKFSINPSLDGSDFLLPQPTLYSYMNSSWRRKINQIKQEIIIHNFDEPENSFLFEKRLHSDFEILGRKVKVIDRFLSFDKDEFSEALRLISEFNEYLMDEYSEQDISIKIEQSENKIRLIVETEGVSKVECERILNSFEKYLLRRASKGVPPYEAGLVVNVNNTNNNTSYNNNSIDFHGEFNRTKGLINQLIEEIDSDPDVKNKLTKIIESSKCVSKPEEVNSSAFFSRLSDFLEQAKSQGSKVNKIISTSSECAEIIRKIAERVGTLSGMF